MRETSHQNELMSQENKDQYSKVKQMEDKFRMAEKQWDMLQGEGQRAHQMRAQIENEKEQEIEEMMKVIQSQELKIQNMEIEKSEQKSQ